ncbi:unnamed protein product [Merluccius merluccius]
MQFDLHMAISEQQSKRSVDQCPVWAGTPVTTVATVVGIAETPVTGVHSAAGMVETPVTTASQWWSWRRHQ